MLHQNSSKCSTRSVPSVSEYSFYTECKLTGISLYRGQSLVQFVSLDPAVFILNMWKGLFDLELSIMVHFVSLFKWVFFRLNVHDVKKDKLYKCKFINCSMVDKRQKRAGECMLIHRKNKTAEIRWSRSG